MRKKKKRYPDWAPGRRWYPNLADSCKPRYLPFYTSISIKLHDDVMPSKHFPHYWPFMRGPFWSPMDSCCEEPAIWGSDFFFVRRDKPLNKQSSYQRFATPYRSCNINVMKSIKANNGTCKSDFLLLFLGPWYDHNVKSAYFPIHIARPFTIFTSFYPSVTFKCSALVLKRGKFSPISLRQTLHSSPVRARYGVFVVSLKSDIHSATVIAVPYVISWKKMDRVITIRLYATLKCFRRSKCIKRHKRQPRMWQLNCLLKWLT